MSGENKRLFGDREEKEEIQAKEEMLKRFEGKNVFMAKLMYRKLLQWTEEQKKEWIASPSCSSLVGDSFLFACKQVLGSMFHLGV